MAKVLFHIDLNAFFSSAEEIRHPEYKGKPIAIGSLSSRGVLSTANYIAREYGVHSAMPVFMAKEKCPELIIIPGDYPYYRSLSNAFFNYLRRYSDKLEPVSIDECFLDVSEEIKKYKRPLDMAVQIQQGLKEETGLTCSIGVAPNRFLAKMASDMRKPNGITVIRKSEIPNKLWPLTIDKMIGIGKKSVPLLEKNGIHLIKDTADPENENKIMRLLGKNGYSLIQKARGLSSAKLNFSTSHKSVSLSKTYPVDLFTEEEVLMRARELAQELSLRMKRKHQKGRLISLVLRDTEFHNQMRSITLKQDTNDFALIYETIQALVEENFEEVGYRHIGISVGSLKNESAIIEQPTIFEKPINTTQDILIQLNKAMPGHVFMSASDLLKRKEKGVDRSDEPK